MNDKQWMTPAEAAAALGLTKNSLEFDRRQPKPMVPYVRYNARVVRYRREAVEAAIARCTHGGEVQA